MPGGGGGGYPMSGGGYPGGPPPPGNDYPRGPGYDNNAGYHGGPPGAPSGGTSSWNPRHGPPPAVTPGGYAPPGGAPPTTNGYPGAPGGNWVGGDQSHGAFYSAPMGQPHMPPTTPQQSPYGSQGYNGAPPRQQQYQYSQCTGKKKALCIGINYHGQSGELRGCINDALNMKTFLMRRFGYKSDDMVMLLDNATNPRQLPTRDNIMAAMQWLVRGAQPNDSLWFHYSGHGGQTKDRDGDEEDGHDEVIYPLDHEVAGHIVDDDMYEIMVRGLPIGCRLTAIFDSCHSGSVLDLPYIYSTEGKIKEPNQALEAGKGAMQAISAYSKGDMGGVFKAGMGIFKTATGGQSKATKIARETRTSEADVIQWSGCKDSQTSADATEAGKATGAMSFAFITSMDAQPNQTYQQLLVSIREILRNKYEQKPQLSCSHPMDTSILFIA